MTVVPLVRKGIPTTYANVNMRSRLEARWAAFFDLCGWRWEYEPIDEIGWVPDFLLIGKRDVVKVEVKPIAWTFQDAMDCDTLIPSGIDYGLDKVHNYIEANKVTIPGDGIPACDEDVLLLGAYPHIINCWAGSVALGVFLSEKHGTPDAAILAEGYAPQRFDFHALYGSYHYRMGGQYDGDGHLKRSHSDDVRKLWAEAGNTVQWKRAA